MFNNKTIRVVLLFASILIFVTCIAPEKKPDDKESVQVEIESNIVSNDTTETESDQDSNEVDVPEVINPHFTGKYCEECHEEGPEVSGDNKLKFDGDYTQLCKCHNYTPGTYIHPVDIRPSEEKLATIPNEFPLPDGKVSCITCHDIYEQCKDNPQLRQAAASGDRYHTEEIKFLRGAPFRQRTDLCFRCHDEERYKKFNPHKQLDLFGEIIVKSCLYCHTEKPNENIANFKDVRLVGDLMVICQRCHNIYDRHPANINHFRKPSGKIFQRIKKSEAEFGVVLPLDNEGKVFCATCHNPHEKGVIPGERAGAKGASENYKHRLPARMCRTCHGM